MQFDYVLRGYLPRTADQIKAIWESAHFIFDTNVLLNIYRYSDENREAFFKLLEAIKGRVFIPHRVAEEFARNRLTAIRENYGLHMMVISTIHKLGKDIDEKFRIHPQRPKFRRFIESTKSEFHKQFRDESKKQTDLISNDVFLARLLSIVGNDVGEPFPSDKAREEYARRKAGGIPPFCKMDDDKDESRRIGDVVIWLEILERFKDSNMPLIFVTDDRKENWWQDSGEGRRDPQPTLVREMYDATKADVLFYTAQRFSESAPERLGVAVPGTFTQETNEIRQRENEEQARRIGKARLAVLKDKGSRRDLLAHLIAQSAFQAAQGDSAGKLEKLRNWIMHEIPDLKDQELIEALVSQKFQQPEKDLELLVRSAFLPDARSVTQNLREAYEAASSAHHIADILTAYNEVSGSQYSSELAKAYGEVKKAEEALEQARREIESSGLKQSEGESRVP